MTAALAAQAGVSAIQLAAAVRRGAAAVGLMRKVRARAEGRAGAPILQPLLDLRKLFGKERVHAEQSSVVLPLAPLVLVASVAAAVVIAPLISTRPALGRTADVFVVVFLLLLGSVALALAGPGRRHRLRRDGSEPGDDDRGARRAGAAGRDPRPVLQAGTSNLPAIVTATLAHPGWWPAPQRLLALAALVIVIVAESGRLPVDNPTTHLELTMIHEAMVLEYAGPELALVTLGGQCDWGSCCHCSRICSSRGASPARRGGVHLLLGLAVLAAKTAVIAAAIAAARGLMAKLRLFRVPEMLSAAFVLAVLAVVTGLAVP